MEQHLQAKMKIGDKEYDLRILDISDTWERALARYEIVNSDGALLQPMGTHAREIKFKTYWFDSQMGENPTTAAFYLTHVTFVADCLANRNTAGLSASEITLVHPKYGAIKGFVQNLAIVNDDTQNYATVDVTFIQNGLQNAGPVADMNVLANMKIYQAKFLNRQIGKMSSSMQSSGLGGLLNKVIDGTQQLSIQFKKATNAERSFLHQCDNFLNTADTLFRTIAEPANMVNNAVNFVEDVPSRLIGSMTSCVNRTLGAFSNLVNSPVSFVNNFQTAMDGFISLNAVAQQPLIKVRVQSIIAGQQSTQASVILQFDETNRTSMATVEQGQTFDVHGNRTASPDPLPVMTANDLEAFLFLVRDRNESIIIIDRDNPELMSMSSALVQFVNTIKLDRLQQKTLTVTDQPLHCICQNLGLSYQSGDRVLRLNKQIKNPTFTQGQVQVYVR